MTTTLVPHDDAIHQINSLGGPPLPTGASITTLRVIMENMAAAEAPMSTARIAHMLIARRK